MSTLGDRLKIQRLRFGGKGSLPVNNGRVRDIVPSVQAILNCGDAGSCQGGDSLAAFEWVSKTGGVPDVTCQQYQAKDPNQLGLNQTDCDSGLALCQTCDHQGCAPIAKHPKVTIEEFGEVDTEDNVVAEIYKNGPVVCVCCLRLSSKLDASCAPVALFCFSPCPHAQCGQAIVQATSMPRASIAMRLRLRTASSSTIASAKTMPSRWQAGVNRLMEHASGWLASARPCVWIRVVCMPQKSWPSALIPHRVFAAQLVGHILCRERLDAHQAGWQRRLEAGFRLPMQVGYSQPD